jgi:hypothetical protein
MKNLTMQAKKSMIFALSLSVMLLIGLGIGLTMSTASQLTPDGAARILTNEKHGYSLYYPIGYDVRHPNENEIVIFVGSLLNTDRPRVYIEVREATGRTADQAADELVAEFGVNSIRRTVVTLDGEEAVVLDSVPGQDTNRLVIVVHNDRLYKLTFVPVGEGYGEVHARTEDLYTTIINSFEFLPQSSPKSIVVDEPSVEKEMIADPRGEDWHSPGVGLPPGPRLVVQRPDSSIQYVTLEGTSAVLVADAPASLLPAGYGGVPFGGAPMTDGPMVYVRQWSGGLYVLDTILGQLFPLDFVPSAASPVAARPLTEGLLPEGAPISLAWGEFSASHTATARLYLSAPDGSQKVEALAETYGASDPSIQFVPWRWRQDGRLYLIKQPVDGQGGFFPFVGAANLWVFDPQNGSSVELVSDQVTGGKLCLDAISPDDRLVAHHCDEGQITLLDLETDQAAAVGVPDQMASGAQFGSVRFSPDGSRIAFPAMTGGVELLEETRGYVAVSEGLGGDSHIVATSEPGEWFSVVAWLYGDTLVLQSHHADPDGWPAVWLVGADGSGLVKLVDGFFLAKFDG